jgi:hypothetical protein
LLLLGGASIALQLGLAKELICCYNMVLVKLWGRKVSTGRVEVRVACPGCRLAWLIIRHKNLNDNTQLRLAA